MIFGDIITNETTVAVLLTVFIGFNWLCFYGYFMGVSLSLLYASKVMGIGNKQMTVHS